MAEQKPTIVDVVNVVRSGKQIVVPEEMALRKAITVLERQEQYEEEAVDINSTLDCMPQEGAVALLTVLNREFGYAQSDPFRRQTTIEVRVDVNETVSVPWGAFSIPGVDGRLETSSTEHKGRVVFAITGTVRRKFEGIVKQIVEMVRTEVRENSIYKGKAWRIRTRDDRGLPLPMPEPEFIELNFDAERQLSFSDEIEASLRFNLWGMIENTQAYRDSGRDLHRGVLLSGSYGMGKSMTATVTAIKAVRNGWTMIVSDRATELADVARLARDYGPCVLFCEDIDRVMTGERNIGIDELLNVVDGIESKDAELVVVFTTNDVDSIHEAMLRPGRIDGVVTLSAPDKKAAEKLLRIYSGELLHSDEDISEAAELIAGHRTSAVAEVASRAIAVAIDEIGGVPERITGANLRDAALSVVNQLRSLEKTRTEHVTPVEKAAITLASALKPNSHGNGADGVALMQIPLEMPTEHYANGAGSGGGDGETF